MHNVTKSEFLKEYDVFYKIGDEDSIRKIGSKSIFDNDFYDWSIIYSKDGSTSLIKNCDYDDDTVFAIYDRNNEDEKYITEHLFS